MDKAEYEARAACAGLGWTEEYIKSFVEWHKGQEERHEREARRIDLANAIIDVAITPLREKYAHKDYPKDTTPVLSEEYPEEARRYRRERGG